MTDDHPDSGHSAWADEVAAYALGALDAAEADAFRRHLQTCVLCRDELASLRGVVDALPAGVPTRRAPSALRRRVMGEVAGAHRATRQRRRRPLLRPVLAAAAVLAVVALVGLRIDAFSGPPSRAISARVTGQGTAELRLSAGHGELVLHHFAPPPAGDIYEVWLQRGDSAPIPTAALFSVTAAGDGEVAVPGSLRHVTAVMVTPEPPGGTRVPTHPPVLRVSLS